MFLAVVRRCGLLTDRLAVVSTMKVVSARLVAHDCARSHRAAQRLIEPRSEEGLSRTDGVGRVDDDDVVLVALVLDELSRIGVHLSGSEQSSSERGCKRAVRASVTARRRRGRAPPWLLLLLRCMAACSRREVAACSRRTSVSLGSLKLVAVELCRNFFATSHTTASISHIVIDVTERWRHTFER